MPVYEYFCLNCRKIFKVIRRIIKKNRKTEPCPKCGGRVDPRWSSVNIKTSKKS